MKLKHYFQSCGIVHRRFFPPACSMAGFAKTQIITPLQYIQAPYKPSVKAARHRLDIIK
jgi:hypothetical protein